MTIAMESLAALHRNFPNMFPETPPKPVQRPHSFFRSDIEPISEDQDAPAFSDIWAVVGFLPFLEPAVGNPALACHPTFKVAVLEPFDQAIRDSGFIYPLKLSEGSTVNLAQDKLDWAVALSLDDLRRIMCGISATTNFSAFTDNVVNGVIQTILQRFRDTPRTYVEDLSLLILSFDPMGIDYGFADEYKPEAQALLDRLPLCHSEDNVQNLVSEVFQGWFHDDRPKEEFALLSSQVFAWFQLARENAIETPPEQAVFTVISRSFS